MSVAGNTGCFIYDCLSHSDKAVEKCGLTYIWASYDS